MVLFLVLIHLCLGDLKFLSPQELASESPNIGIVNFGNPSFLNTYAKLVTVSIGICEITGSFNKDEFALVYYSISCNLMYMAETAQDSGASGIIIVLQAEIIGEYVIYAPALTTSASIGIPVILISKSTGEHIKENSDKTIIIKYSYSKFPQSTNPSINAILTSNYTLDLPFIQSLKDLVNNYDDYLRQNDIILTVSSLDIKTYNSTDCIYISDTDFICLSSTESVTGNEKLQNSALIFNYFYSLKSFTEIKAFFDYLIDLYNSCLNNYTIDCNKDVLQKYTIPNEEPTFLYNHNKYSSIIPRYEIAGIDVFWNDYIKDAYCFSRLNGGTMCEFYTETCTYSMLVDDHCSSECNNTAGHYDNLDCVKQDKCYSFLLNNNQCEDICPDDPDCDKDDNKDDLLLVKILVPIFCALILFGVCILIIYLRKIRGKRLYTEVKFNSELRNVDDKLCFIDGKEISNDDECAIMESECRHIFHLKCIKDHFLKVNDKLCPKCTNQSRERTPNEIPLQNQSRERTPNEIPLQNQI
ncbi:hypothetical protein SteCoe_1892 [Stentor coeruleus]|uniref:LNR domain-containing protein n=1 Tax=Stentor coeruleus TaxID=5963 RepID=A0A1R2D0U0_9CILI|nr:hypothetical protein SteCoe_1892 [Stentor coeruleus]